MEYIYGTTDFSLHHTCVTLGKFDGLHRGHQLLLSYLEMYEKQGYTSVMFTFDYHPASLFSAKEIDLIYTEEEKRILLERKGPQVLISYPFSEETASMEPEDFIREVLVGKLDAKIIVVGTDYRFGKKRRGDIVMLSEYAKKYGYELIVCDKLAYHDNVIGSTRIREELRLGHIEDVNEMLGHPYTIMGTVEKGNQIGRTIGIPTVNLTPKTHKLLPPNGVYASITRVNGKSYRGISNVGCKPTVNSDGRVNVETHMLDFNEDLYGHHIEVELYTYERSEVKFNSIDELKDRMNKDIEFAVSYFKRMNIS